MRVFVSAALSVALFMACATNQPGRVAIGDGTYKLSCDRSLGDCLTELATVCSTHGYHVIRAKEEINRTGVPPVETEFVRSEAVIRCRSGVERAETTRSPSAPAAPAARKPRCFPGATQACLGPAACPGAQTCREDGEAYGSCDCGDPNTKSIGEPADAGPASTWGAPVDGGTPDDAGLVP